jgi:hypothetical protein
MNAPFTIPADLVPSEAVYRARCEARALLHVSGQLSLQEAVDELQACAEQSGLVAAIGQDRAQEIMAYAFHAVDFLDDELSEACEREIMLGAVALVRRWEEADGMRKPGPPTRAAPYLTPQSTIDAFWYVVSLDDPEYLKRWFAQHPLDVPALLKLYERRNAA